MSDYIHRELEVKEWTFTDKHGIKHTQLWEPSSYFIPADKIYNGERIDATIIDFAQVFNVVSHKMLIEEIGKTDLDRQVVLWIKEFLNGRSQRVRNSRKLSVDKKIISKALKGSIMGPLQLLIYINDLPNKIVLKLDFY